MKKYLLLFILTSYMSVLSDNSFAQTNTKPNTTQSNTGTSFPDGNQFKNADISYKIIKSENNTWGYNIMKKDRVFIHQPNVPGLPGNEGFKSKKSAQKVAQLVVSKLKKGEMPPSVTKEELKKLKVI